ncbi:PspC domain-containing protein [Pseudonocardia sp. GCM10023141]|uniref:PspC domain-containing protein n=1 Tax=Pseudonocardia sp. GCM10023141 TaxID=3252653 RepID=UPI00361605A4
MNRIDVPNTLREMWETRPARPRDERMIAGVASGIARRYDIDPVLVRVGFVVAAFSGIGAGLYIAGWLLLPDEPVEPGAPVRTKAPRGVLVVGLVIAAFFTLGTLFGGGNRLGDAIVPLLAVAALLFLLHHVRGDRVIRPAAAVPPPVADPMSAPTVATPTGPSMVKTPVGTDPAAAPTVAVEPEAPTPPAWDPLGAAPFAWDLPEPGPAVPVTPPLPARRRWPVTSVTLGLALLAGGGTAVILLLLGALTLTKAPLISGVVLAVLGAGLVVGAFVRSGRGLIPFAVLGSLLTWGLLAAPLSTFQGGGLGDVNATPITVSQLQPNYQLSAGDITLDLRKLDLSVPAGGDNAPVRTSASVGAGTVSVLVGPDTDVTLNASAGLGSVSFGGREANGPGADIHATEDLGADGVRAGRLLVIDIEAGVGDVEVRRG